MEYDASLVSVSGCDVYDGSLPGPWDGDMTLSWKIRQELASMW